MSSYLSNLLTHTTTRYNSLRRTLLSSEDDGDTEDDTHITRVLRAYYTEKGRPFPPWLPPDPNDKRSITPQPTSGYGASYVQGAAGYFTGAAGRNIQQQQPPAMTGSKSSLSDLWDPAPGGGPQAAAAPQSLRNSRRVGVVGGVPQMGQQPTSSLAPPHARPLPSQRAGSYQSVQSQQQQRYSGADQSPPGSSAGSIGGGAGTAQERLKARLWGGRSSGAQAPPPTSQSSMYGGGQQQQQGNPYGAGGGYGRR